MWLGYYYAITLYVVRLGVQKMKKNCDLDLFGDKSVDQPTVGEKLFFPFNLLG